jgi:outer membrane protein assembly factor BamB
MKPALVRCAGAITTVLVLSQTTAVLAWIASSPNLRAYHLAVDSAGDVIAGPTQGGRTVRKLDGDTGKELWAADFDGQAEVDAAGDVYVYDTDADCGFCTVVAKLSGTNGAVLWTQESFTGGGDIIGISEGGAGGVFVHVGGNEGDVAKLDVSSGAVLWQRTSIAFGSVVDAAGDVIVNRRDEATSHLVVTKLSGATGATIWETDTGEVLASAVEVGALEVDGAGDVFTGRSDDVLFKLDGTTGGEIWQIAPPAFLFAVDSNGDLLLGDGGTTFWKLTGASGMTLWSAPGDGRLVLLPGDDMLAMGPGNTLRRYDASSGTLVWQHPVFGGEISLSVVYDVALGQRGLFVSGASFFGDPRDLVVGLGARLAGKTLVLRDDPTNPASSLLSLVAKDGLFHPPGPAGAGPDPTVNGATVAIANPVTLEAASLPLPAANWTVKETTTFGRYAYTYRDPAGTSPRCRASLRSPAKLKVKCVGTLGGFTLDEPSQGGLDVTLTMGTGGHDYCLAFGGDVVLDVGSGGSGKGIFKARNAGPATDCPGGF